MPTAAEGSRTDDKKQWRALGVRLSASQNGRVGFVWVRREGGGKAVSVVGLPRAWGAPEATGEALGARFGAVTRAVRTAHGALIEFATERGAEKCARAAAAGASEPLAGPAAAAAAPAGLAAWVAEHRGAFPGNAELQRRLDAWSDARDEEEARAREAAEAAAAHDDGWTVVGAKRGRRKTSDGAGTAVGGVKAARAQEKGTKRAANQLAGLPDFYRFQQREAQRDAVADLQRAFAEDKRRVAELKAARRFKPY